MDVQDGNHDGHWPPRSLPKGRSRKKQRPKSARSALPPDVAMQLRQLMEDLKSDDTKLSNQTIASLRRSGCTDLMHLILQDLDADLHSRSKKVRESAFVLVFLLGPRLFGAPPPPPSLDELTKALLHPDPEVRRQAVEAIGDMGKAAQPALGLLHQMLTNADPKVQLKAAVAITGITGSLPEKPRTAPVPDGSTARPLVDDAGIARV